MMKLAVHALPDAAGAWPRLSATQPTVLALKLPRGTRRERAREQVRTALRGLLGAHFGIAAEAVALSGTPGQPIRLDHPEAPIEISISHAEGCSLLALWPQGEVGVDLMLPIPLPEMQNLASQYLGPEVAQTLAAVAVPKREQAFAAAWCRHEAALKCLGEPLDEWSEAMAARLLRCRLAMLDLPAPWVGATAWLT
ncbi:MAG TPA: 4'-phosphopantetheinyl transferase superfamily protein [Methylibium sp.]